MNIRYVHRSLPPQLGQMVANYLVFVLPIRYLALWWSLRGEEPEVPEEEITTEASKALFLTYLWARKHDRWDSSELSDLLKRETVKFGLPELSIQSWRQISVAIASHFFKAHQEGMDFEDDETKDDEETGFENSDPWDQLGSHSTSVAERAYGVRLDIGYAKTEMLLLNHVKACKAWQAWLKVNQHHQPSKVGSVGSATGSATGSKHARSESSALVCSQPKRSLKALAIQLRWSMEEVDRRVGLLFKTKGPRYRCPEQRTALEHVVTGSAQVLAVLPTGGGKSLLFQLPSCLVGAKHTVVIIPFRALLDDMMEKTKKLGIPSSRWDSVTEGQLVHNLIFASVEQVQNSNFHAFLQSLQATGSLDRIVLDECHLVLTEDVTYRPSLLSLNELRTHSVQMVCLTATLPISEEIRFRRLLCFEEQDLEVVRASTSRFNLKIQCTAGGDWEASQELAVDTLKRWAVGEENRNKRAVCFVNDRKLAEKLSKRLDCLCYHAGTENKPETFEMWRSANQPNHRVMITTAALYQGVDLKRIGCVVMLESPGSVYNLVQAMGRAGRDGAQASILIIVPDKWRPRFSTGASDSHALLEEFLVTKTCRHSVLSAGMDDRTERCDLDEPGLISCDNCARSSAKTLDWFKPELPPVRADSLPVAVPGYYKTVATAVAKTSESITQKQLRKGSRILVETKATQQKRTETLEKVLLQFARICGICYASTVLLGEVLGHTHSFNECTQKYSIIDARKQAMEDTGKKWLAPGLCFVCLLPDQICGRDNGRCTQKYKDAVLPLCWSVFQDQRLRTHLPEEAKAMDIRKYTIWLGQKPVGIANPTKTCNAARLIEKLVESSTG